MKVHSNSIWRVALPALAVAAGTAAIGMGGTLPDAAEAADVCPDGVVTSVAPTVDAQVFDVEGKIGAFDAGARTITANGMKFRIPATEKIKTEDLDQATGNIEFSGPGSLTDPIRSSIVGSTAIASGTVQATPNPETGNFCVTFDATSVYVEPAEHGVVGPLLSVDVSNQSFVVGGTTVKMNPDSRYPSKIIDLAGTQMTIADLQSQVGTLLDVVGYYDDAAGKLQGMIVEADVLMPKATTDTVAVTRAQWKSQELRVRGAVSRGPDGQFAATVDLYTGGTDGTNCTGTKLSTAGIDPAGDGAFDFRVRNTTNPGTVCVKSLGGGVDDSPVVLG